jgi:hypothetical protein
MKVLLLLLLAAKLPLLLEKTRRCNSGDFEKSPDCWRLDGCSVKGEASGAGTLEVGCRDEDAVSGKSL